MSRRRLLIVSDEMEVGGSQRQIVNLLHGLDRDRFEPVLLYFRNPSHLVDEIERTGVPVVQIPKRGRIDLRFLAAFVRFLRRESFDVIHAFSFTGELWTAVALLAAPGPVLITSIRGTYEWYSAMQWRLKRWVTGRSRWVVANSETGGRYAFEQMRLPDDKLRIIHNGVREPAGPRPLPDDLREFRARHELVLTFVGRLVDHKDLSTLLQAMTRVGAACGRDVGLLIVGDGPQRAMLEARASELGLDTVRFLGQRDDVPAILAHSDAGALSSVREGLSNTLLETMLAGLPMVATRVGGTPEVIQDRRNGLLVPARSPEAFADAVIELHRDRQLRHTLGQQAAEDARTRFSVPAMVRQFEGLYEQTAAIASSNPEPPPRRSSNVQ